MPGTLTLHLPTLPTEKVQLQFSPLHILNDLAPRSSPHDTLTKISLVFLGNASAVARAFDYTAIFGQLDDLLHRMSSFPTIECQLGVANATFHENHGIESRLGRIHEYMPHLSRVGALEIIPSAGI